MADVSPGHSESPLTVWGAGQQESKARRQGGVVFRRPGPWSPTVIALLRHLEDAGFAGAPRVVGTGFAEDGREVVTFVPGASPQPYAWATEGVAGVGRLLRELHAATTTFKPPADARWQPWFGRALHGSDPVIGHCDTGPWNFIARDGQPVALVDWELAGPVDAVWELAQTAWLNAQLHDDDLAERLNLPEAAARASQLRLILDGYGLPARHRADFLDKMIEYAVHSAREDAIEANVTYETTSAISGGGYPVLWGITWRTRSASWMLRNRSLLQRAITVAL